MRILLRKLLTKNLYKTFFSIFTCSFLVFGCGKPAVPEQDWNMLQAMAKDALNNDYTCEDYPSKVYLNIKPTEDDCVWEVGGIELPEKAVKNLMIRVVAQFGSKPPLIITPLESTLDFLPETLQILEQAGIQVVTINLLPIGH